MEVLPDQVEHHGLNAGLSQMLRTSLGMAVQQILHDGDGLLDKQCVGVCNGDLGKDKKSSYKNENVSFSDPHIIPNPFD